MKLVKKILMGLVATAVVLSLASCDGLLPKDDTEGAITGSLKNYKVSYTNESTTNPYRAYKATTLKHAGALVKVTFDSNNVNTSKMGVIFDLKADTDNKDARQFYIIGLNPRSDKSNFYVSKFTNVTDIQAWNFGTAENPSNTDEQNAAVKANPSKEVEIVPLSTTNNIKFPEADANGKFSVYVWYKAKTDGSFDYKVLNITDEVAKAYKFDTGAFDAATILAQGNTHTAGGKTVNKVKTAEFDACDEGKQPKNKVAFYAQIAPNTTLNGSWKVIGTYLEAEDAE